MSSWMPFLAITITIVGFGSNFVPLKGIEVHNHAFFQWVMCNAILLTAFPYYLYKMDSITFEPFASIGGVSWCLGNFLCPFIIDRLGLGVGSLLWGTVEMFTAWFSGTLGILGVEKQVIASPWLNLLGVTLILSGGVLLSQVSMEEDDAEIIDTENDKTSSRKASNDNMGDTLLRSHQRGIGANIKHEDEHQTLEEYDIENRALKRQSTVLNELINDAAFVPYESLGTLTAAAIEDAKPLTRRYDNTIYSPSSRIAHSSHGSTLSSECTTPLSRRSNGSRLSINTMTFGGSAVPSLVQQPSTSKTHERITKSPSLSSPLQSSSGSDSFMTLNRFQEGILLSLTAGILFGVAFNPTQYLVDNSDGKLLASNLVISHYIGICYTSYVLYIANAVVNYVHEDKTHHYEDISCSQRDVTTSEQQDEDAKDNFQMNPMGLDSPKRASESSHPNSSNKENITPSDEPLHSGEDQAEVTKKEENQDNPGEPSSKEEDSSTLYRFVDPVAIVPALFAGILWGVAAITWFYAAETLPMSVTFPLISAGPNVVTMTWSMCVFREVTRTRDQRILKGALACLALGLLCVWWSNHPTN